MNPQKIKTTISLFLLLMLVWGNFSLFHFSHFHVDPSGRVLLL